MRDKIFSLLHDLGIPQILRMVQVGRRQLSILMFHRVSDVPDPLWPPLPTKTFFALIRELSRKATVVALERIDEIEEYPQKPLVALSFDDGYGDFYDNAVPILDEFGVPAHHNICPGLIDRKTLPWTQVLGELLWINRSGNILLPDGERIQVGNEIDEAFLLRVAGKLYGLNDELREDWINVIREQILLPADKKLMGWEQIRECADANIHIGSHGMNHRNISMIGSRHILVEEVVESKKKIGKMVGVDPAIFAFPNGLYTKQSTEIVKSSGYKVALLCEDRTVPYIALQGNSFMALPRISISKKNWKEENLRSLGFHQSLLFWKG